MDNIYEILKNRTEISLRIAERTVKYLNIIREIVLGISVSDYDSAEENIAFIFAFVKNVPEYKLILTDDARLFLDNFLKLYIDLAKVSQTLIDLYALFENQTYEKLAIYNMSATYATNIYREKADVASFLEKYKEISVRDDEIIFMQISTLQLDNKIVFDFIMENETIVNKFMTKILNMTIPRNSGSARRRLELIIEHQKDLVLGSQRINIAKWKGIQGILVRYNLHPITSSMPLAELFAIIGMKYDAKITADENFKKITSVILINKSNSSPIEFNLQGLIDLEFIIKNNLKTKPMKGLNARIIEKYNTAKMLKSDASGNELTKIYGQGDKYYIFETIDGDLYRLLGRDGNAHVPSDQITGLLKGLSGRSHQYNTIQGDIILRRCFDSKYLHLLSMFVEHTERPSADPIKTSIVDKLVKSFESQIAEIEVEGVRHFKSLVVDRNRIHDVLLKIINPPRIQDHGAPEIMMSYLAKLDSITTTFIKELERRWQDVTISDRMFSEHDKKEVTRICIQIFTNIVKSAADELDQSNAWTEPGGALKTFFIERKDVLI